MGNCYTLCRPIRRSSTGLDNVLRIVKSDGKILEFRAPILVMDLLASFTDYGGVGISKEASQYLPPDYELKIGDVYYLLPSAASLPPVSSLVDHPAYQCRQKKQIKVVIAKQQLQELLSKMKTVTVEELLSVSARLDQKGAWEGVDSPSSWRPKLETIPEGCE